MHKNITKGKVQLKILITSADENITQALDSIVIASGHISKSVTHYENFSEECNKIGADLALIDSSVKFGGKQRNILELIRDLRHDIPIILLVNSTHHVITRKNIYYIKKPLALVDLQEAIMRFSYIEQEVKEIKQIKIGTIRYDESKRVILYKDQEVLLTSLENKILKILVENNNKTITRKVLLEKVWGYSSNTHSQTIETHIWRLRKKLNIDKKSTSMLKTVRGGYCFKKDY